MNRITRSELSLKLEGDNAPKLVAVLSPWNFLKQHIPGSLNFRSADDALAALSPEDEIVLYCAGRPCMNSSWAYQLLVKHGFQDVRVYEGGLVDWAEACLPLSGMDQLLTINYC